MVCMENGMTPDTIAIIAVGIALGGLMLQLARNTNRRFDDVNRRFDDLKSNVNQRFNDFNQRFDDFKNEVNRRFDDVDRRFEKVDRRFEEVDRRFDDAARRNEAAHAQIASNISELRADFRSVIPRAAAERPNRAVAADRNPID